MRDFNKRMLVLLAVTVGAFLLLALLASIFGTPIKTADATHYEFSKEIRVREDGRRADLCIWTYKDQRVFTDMKLGTCFEDGLTHGDSGHRFADGSAPFDYIEFVGMRNATRSISEWHYKRVAIRRLKEKERVAKIKNERTIKEINKMESELDMMMATYNAKIEAMKNEILKRFNNLQR